VLPEARRLARRLGPDAFAFEWGDAPAVAKDVILYVKGNEREPKLRAFLGRFRKRRYRRIVVYSPIRSPETAARLGMMIGNLALNERSWYLNLSELQVCLKDCQLLCSLG
jgi:hypothetical protein